MRQLKAAKRAHNAIINLHTVLFEADMLGMIDADRLTCAMNDVGSIIIDLEAMNADNI